MLELLGLGRHQRRSVGVAEMVVALATEIAYAKAVRLLVELVGIDLSARSVRRDTVSLTPTQIGSETLKVASLLLDGTGVSADVLQARLHKLLTDAYATGDLGTALAA